jgi:hypothetical protein
LAAVKNWEIVADNLSKAGWSWAVFRPLIVRGGQSGLLTLTATENVSSCVRADEKLTAFLELELATRACSESS